MKRMIVSSLLIFACVSIYAQSEPFSKGGANQKTPSKSEYFSWIDNTWEGSTEAQTIANLNFFKYLKDHLLHFCRQERYSSQERLPV